MTRIKTSFIATVYNEEESIEEFITSVLAQTQRPDEIIIVDAGSRDSTRKIIKRYENILLYTKKGNRSVGRNFAIQKARYEIIIASDAGCVLDKNFIMNIALPFTHASVDVVSGFYYPVINSVFEKCLATYTCVMPDKVNPNTFLPSSRSVAFRKSAWKEVGGYPELLNTCEDLIFAKKMKDDGFVFRFAKKAYVHWRQKKNLSQAARQFYSYSEGDGRARYFRPQTPFLYIRYISALFIIVYGLSVSLIVGSGIALAMFATYSLWAIKKNYRYVEHWKAFIYLPLLQFTADIAVLAGMTRGLLQR
jgi:glycosyltransferase involved in cell wall biosynthesis